MFVRLQFQLPSGKKRSPGALQIGSAKTSCKQDAWLALSQERLDISGKEKCACTSGPVFIIVTVNPS